MLRTSTGVLRQFVWGFGEVIEFTRSMSVNNVPFPGPSSTTRTLFGDP